MSRSQQTDSAIAADAIRKQLDTVLRSPEFSNSPILCRFLRYVVEKALSGDAESVKEYSIGVEVFRRGDSFDPTTDTIVRANARRLRKKLTEYYANGGWGDAIVIELPAGAYQPHFEVTDHPQRWTALPTRRLIVLAGAALVCAGAAALIGALMESRGGLLEPGAFTQTSLTSYRGEETAPALSPDGTRVAFSWTGATGDNADIYVQLIGTASPMRLTTHPAAESYPVFSPDGRTIAFLRMVTESRSRAAVVLVSALGGPERKVFETNALRMFSDSSFTNSLSELSWSPDGEWLAFPRSADSDGPARVSLYRIGTGEVRWVTSPAEHLIGDSSPAFSPDGRELAFVRRAGWGAGHEIFVQPLTEDLQSLGEARQITAFDRFAMSPAWSPEGRELVFGAQGLAGKEGIWAAPANGQERPRFLWAVQGVGSVTVHADPSRSGVRIAYEVFERDSDIWQLPLGGERQGQAFPVISRNSVDGQAKFSPDGNRLVLTDHADLWVCDRDGASLRKLTDLRAAVTGGPSWSPDGTKIVFQSRPKGQADIYVVSVDGGAPRQVTGDPADEAQPTWSRDGKRIYFISNRGGDYSIWQTASDGAEAIQVTTARSSQPRESLDGKSLYFYRPDESSVYRVPVRNGQSIGAEELLIAKVKRDVMTAYLVGARGLYFQSEDGRLQFLDLASREVTESIYVEGQITSLSPDERSLLFTHPVRSNVDLVMLENTE